MCVYVLSLIHVYICIAIFYAVFFVRRCDLTLHEWCALKNKSLFILFYFFIFFNSVIIITIIMIIIASSSSSSSSTSSTSSIIIIIIIKQHRTCDVNPSIGDLGDT